MHEKFHNKSPIYNILIIKSRVVPQYETHFLMSSYGTCKSPHFFIESGKFVCKHVYR